MNLTESIIRDTTPGDKPIRLTDAHGLYLEVAVSGTKTFRMKYRFEGQRPTIKLGTYPELSLAQARAACDQVRAALADGINPKTLDFDSATLDPMPAPMPDPVSEPSRPAAPDRAERVFGDVDDDGYGPSIGATGDMDAEADAAPATGDVPASSHPGSDLAEGAWDKVATDYLLVRQRQGLNARTQIKLDRQIEATRQAFGDKHVSEITPQDILDLVHPYEDKGEFETAREIRSWCSQVFDFATARGFANDNPAQVVRADMVQRRRGTAPEITDPREVAKTLEQFPDGSEVDTTVLDTMPWGRTLLVAAVVAGVVGIAAYWLGHRAGSEPTVADMCETYFARIAIGVDDAQAATDTERCTAILQDYYGVVGR